jgi:hypothetical protein
MDVKSSPSLSEFFREAVTKALKNQGLDTTELTEFYLVNLLSDYASTPISEQTLALTMLEGLSAPPGTRAQKLREVGDTSLFVSGFFPDSLNHSLVDVDYYIGMGEVAYGHLARMVARPSGEPFTRVFGELSTKFSQFVQVLGEVSSDSSLGSSVDVLRLYEKYVKTGSDTVLARLHKHGLLVSKGTVH